MDQTLESSFALQAKIFEQAVIDPDQIAIAETWLSEEDNDTAKLANEGYDVGGLFAVTAASVITVCDGRFGLDAIRLRKMGALDVLPTDICPHLLEKAKAEGLIDDFRIENAEQLSLSDDSFDFVYCREGFHHIPRAWIAFYEMMRVARRGVILYEPQAQDRTFYSFLRKLKRKRNFMNADYEPCGNFVYRLSYDELLRVCFGLNLPYIAICQRNAAYVDGMEFTSAGEVNKIRFYYNLQLLARRVASVFGLINATRLGAIVFKINPTNEERDWLEQNGWNLIRLQRNPYIPLPGDQAQSAH
jgi:SAM-dependent methyltransferase